MLEHDWFPRPLPANVEISERSWLYSSFAFLHYASARECGVSIGHDTGVYAGTFFDLGPDGQVRIGKFSTVVGTIFCTNRLVEVGDYTFVSHEVVIADQPHATPAPDPSRWTERDNEPIVLGECSWVGARAVLLAGARLGVGAVVGAASVVDFEVPDYAIVAGNPARVVGEARPRERQPDPE